jgi:branched-chain amino acid transport system substrate-binding protein
MLALILVFLLGVGAYHFTTTLGPASTTIEIASELPTSGLDRTIGLPVQNGVQMAIDEANHNGLLPGYTLKLTPYDDVGRGNRHDDQVGASNLRNAIADNLVAGVVGPYNSIVAQAEAPIANQAPIALISPTTTYPCLTKNSSVDPDCTETNDIAAQMRPTGQLTYFRLSTTDDREGKAAADYFAQHYHKVLLIKDDSDLYSAGLAEAFQHEWASLSGMVIPLGLRENRSSIQDYQNTLQAVAPLQPDLIYFAGNDPNGTYVLQALSNVPQLKTVTFAGAGGTMNSNFLQAAAQLRPSAPVYVSLPIQDPPHSGTPVGIDFERNYTASGYSNYRPYAASAYSCTMMLIQAIKTVLQKKGVSTPHGTQDQVGAKQFRQAILQELAHLTYTGVTGKQSFDANGDTTNHTTSFYQLDLSKPQPDWAWLQQVPA